MGEGTDVDSHGSSILEESEIAGEDNRVNALDDVVTRVSGQSEIAISPLGGRVRHLRAELSDVAGAEVKVIRRGADRCTLCLNEEAEAGLCPECCTQIIVCLIRLTYHRVERKNHVIYGYRPLIDLVLNRPAEIHKSHHLLVGRFAVLVECCEVNGVEVNQKIYGSARIVVDGLEVTVFSTGLDVRVQLVEAHELPDHVLKEGLEPVGSIAELLNGVLAVHGIVDPRKLAVELSLGEIARNELCVSLQSRNGVRLHLS